MFENDNEVVTRFVPLRAARIEADERELNGYAIVFNSLSQDLGGFKERIAPSAVDRTMREGSNVDALTDHERKTSTILGSTDSGLLKQTKDRTGLKIRISPPDTQYVRDLLTVVKAGLAKGMSFAFRVMPDGQVWDEEGELLVRTVTDMIYSEVSVVVNPAYLETEISARNLQIDKRTLEQFKDSQTWKPSLRMRERMVRAGLR
jgi:HK97 family phage prohead protease